jgi:hypothetical protein
MWGQSILVEQAFQPADPEIISRLESLLHINAFGS